MGVFCNYALCWRRSCLLFHLKCYTTAEDGGWKSAVFVRTIFSCFPGVEYKLWNQSFFIGFVLQISSLAVSFAVDSLLPSLPCLMCRTGECLEIVIFGEYLIDISAIIFAIIGLIAGSANGGYWSTVESEDGSFLFYCQTEQCIFLMIVLHEYSSKTLAQLSLFSFLVCFPSEKLKRYYEPQYHQSWEL